MKRIPILASDAYLSFKHIGKGQGFNVKTPRNEEIYANKIVTMLDRATPRDLYDVNSISEASFDMDLLRKCTVVKSLMSLKKSIMDINVDEIVKAIPYDARIRLVTRSEQEPDISKIRHKASRFSQKIIDSLTDGERLCIDRFY